MWKEYRKKEGKKRNQETPKSQNKNLIDNLKKMEELLEKTRLEEANRRERNKLAAEKQKEARRH